MFWRKEATEPVDRCNVCGSTHWRVFYRGKANEWAGVRKWQKKHGRKGSVYERVPRRFKYHACRRCGLIFANPRPTDELVNSFYRDYFAGVFEGYVGAYESSHRQVAFDEYLAVAEERVEPGALLDIGCADGGLLCKAHERNWTRTDGIEVSEAAARSAERFGRILTGDVHEQLSRVQARYDAVFLIDTLEHLKDPRAVVEGCAAILVPGGVLVSETPDPQTRWDYMSRHFHLFPQETMVSLMKTAGFESAAPFSITTSTYNKTDKESEGRFLRIIAQMPGTSTTVRV